MSGNVATPPTRLLMGPGPTNPDPRVTEAMAAPLVGHLDPYFLTVMDETMRDLRALFRTGNHHTIPMSGTGSAGLETIATNILEPGDSVLVGVIGYFGERLAELCRRTGAEVHTLEAQWGDVIDPGRIANALDAHPAKLVYLVHVETSTGAAQPLEEIGRIVRERESLLAVDCVTSLAGMPFDAEGWMIDAAGSCSQKCIGAPPGSGPITVGPRAMKAIRGREHPPTSWYFDLALLFKYWGEGSGGTRAFHHTAPVANLYGFREALRQIHGEGLDARWARHQRAHQRLVAGLERIGLELFTPSGHRAPMLNVVTIPDGVNDKAVRKRLLEEMGIEIGGGFGPLAGKVWRIGLMGVNANDEPVDRLLAALGEVLER